MDSSFVQAPVQVPRLSGFDKSHQNLLSTKVGTITPILVDELIPGAKASCKLAISCSLPPLASETYMRVQLKVEAFFVPFRLLAGSFESWFTDQPKKFAPYSWSGTSITPTERKGLLPVIGAFNGASDVSGSNLLAELFSRSGSLGDYLGFKEGDAGVLDSEYLTALPFLAYHRIYHDWYRNSLVQSDVFLPPTYNNSNSISPASQNPVAGTAPYDFFGFNGAINAFSNYEALLLADGVYLYELRQRNFGLDYFTTATPQAQQGSPEVVSFSTSGSTGQFSIAALRGANSLQQFKERNNLLGNLYVEQVYGRYGVRPSDGIAQRSLFIGSGVFDVYSKGIYESSTGVNGSSETLGTNNPFGGVPGARYGSAYASGQEFIVSGFEAKEPGYLMIMATLVPKVTYSTGIRRYLRHYIASGSLADLANPILQNVGPQPIYSYELNGQTGSHIFGFTDRYAEFKTLEDELHGEVRDGYSLQSFAAQRSFDPSTSLNQEINSAFLQIPTNYLDQVFAVNSEVSRLGCWLDCYFDYKVAQPLAKYALPSLQDPAYEHGKTIVVNRGGFKL